MTKQEIMRDLKKDYGAFPTKSQLKKYLRCGGAHLTDLMDGVMPVSDGRAVRYFIGDVADRIMKSRTAI